MKPDRWTCEPLRPIDAITPPAFALPEGLCDAHMHVFGPERDYRPIENARYDWPAASLDHYLEIADRLSIDRIVFVQPSYYGTDNSCMFDLMAKVRRPFRAVVFMSDETSHRDLDRMHELGVRGLRLDLFKAAEDGGTLADMEAMLEKAAAFAAPHGWHVEIYGPGYTTHKLLGALSRLPVPVSINHFGYMSEAEGMLDDHFRDFVAFVEASNIWVKLTAPYRLKPASPDRATWMAHQLIEAAPDRIVWGTDWPHIPLGGLDTGALFNNLLEWCPDEGQRNAILADNPARLYGFV